MKKQTKISLWVVGGLVVLGGVAVAVGPSLYSAYADSQASAPPTLDPSIPAGESQVDVDNLSGTWQVGADSFAGYRVNEVLSGTPAVVTGRTGKVTGSVTVDGLTLSAATITVDVGSIATDQPPRDAYFRDNALQVSQFPTATFTLTAPIAADKPEAGKPQSFEATGDLMLHGVTKPVTVKLEAALTQAGGQVTGSIPITFADYGVQAPSLGFVEVEKTGSVEFLLNLSQK
jgi:polyisoprenoid-binding protein YceI